MSGTLTRNQLGELAGCCEGNPRETYSGRGMYGKMCIGVVTENPDKLKRKLKGILGAELAYDLLENWTTDNMGMSTIVYFPKFTVGG